ncbi:MAG: prepilin-type N-terminal cleavage/methylation domain-containing protein [Vicinamibacteria bacterium]|nr:prepilin-type N-terminal cleavage/methylation domain-containing protein [Vicinamibacteria bacterium]
MQSGKEQGFTLVEVLCAIVILAFGLVAVANLLVVAMASNAIAQVSTAATARATEHMERLMSMSIGGTQGGPKLDLVGNGNETTLMGLGDSEKRATIQTSWIVTLVAADPRSSVYHIQVQSQGVGPLMGSRSRVVLTTFRTQASQ